MKRADLVIINSTLRPGLPSVRATDWTDYRPVLRAGGFFEHDSASLILTQDLERLLDRVADLESRLEAQRGTRLGTATR